MKRMQFIKTAALVPAAFCAGCAAIDVSARGEGTGIQIIGAIVVLAKYQASARQKTVADGKARRAFVDLAMKPAYEARTKKLRQLAKSAPAARRKPTGGSKPDVKTAAAEKARDEIQAVTVAWREAAASLTLGQYAGDFAVEFEAESGEIAQFESISKSQVIAASAGYVPQYLAVSVPAERGIPGSKSSVMLWDTKENRLSSDTVYALDRTLPASKPAQIDNLKVLYAGP